MPEEEDVWIRSSGRPIIESLSSLEQLPKVKGLTLDQNPTEPIPLCVSGHPEGELRKFSGELQNREGALTGLHPTEVEYRIRGLLRGRTILKLKWIEEGWDDVIEFVLNLLIRIKKDAAMEIN